MRRPKPNLIRAGQGGIGSKREQIPAQPGIYAWHYRYTELVAALDPKSASTPQEVHSLLMDELKKPHQLHRDRYFGEIGLRVSLDSERTISKSKRIIEQLEASPALRQELWQLMNESELWQQPLYVGKSDDLRTRFKQHLRADSTLRRRLREARITLDWCSFQYILTEGSGAPELLEEVAARLFLPPFCKQLG